ncbi:MAG: GIY-YIG nuclease family protein [Ruminococcaceae bacterium]|nr:GIY-YIG nuclease family protein [Oscillospiraceae bacterium]
MYYIYMLRCEDNSLYTGITTDIKRRFEEHSTKSVKGAKYTHTHSVLKIERIWETDTRQNASKLEYRLKRLRKEQKELLASGNADIDKFLSEIIDCSLFRNTTF